MVKNYFAWIKNPFASKPPITRHVAAPVYNNTVERRLQVVEEKSYSGDGCYTPSLMSGFNRPQSIAANVALDYYAKIQPVSSSIDKITEELVSLEPIVFNMDSEEVLTSHPVLDLLEVPNPFCKYPEFMKGLATDFLVSGNAFIVCSGNINAPAQEIYRVSPREVRLNVGPDGYVDRISIQTRSESIEFNLNIKNVNGKREARYLASSNKEIFHIKNPNPFGQSYSPWGFSRLTPLFQEMEQYLHANTHNLSLLVKGGRPSMMVILKEQLTQDQLDEVNAQIAAYVSGPDNAGTIMTLPVDADVKEMSTSNKDMDFDNMRKSIIASIHTQLGVPLPLVMPEQMTLANMIAANAQFYNSTVIPVANRIFSELTDLLMPRYKTPADLDITFDRRAIPALEAEAVENVKAKAQLNVMTDNELRTEIGLEHIEGADKLYKPAGLMPIGSTPKNEQPPIEQFVNKMKNIRTRNNERMFSDEKIQAIIEKHRLV